MRNLRRRLLPLLAVVLLLCTAMTTPAFGYDPTEEPGTKMIECTDCGGSTACMSCYGLDEACEDCGGENVCAACGGTGYVESSSRFFNTAWALLPPVIAIALALLTKEVYSSLFIGILVGGLLYANFNVEGAIHQVISGGIIASLADSYNVGILAFLVILGVMACLTNKAGGSAAFGRWAKTHIKSRAGAQLAAILLGCLIFIDDYFNCLTVGSVMRPVTDKHGVSRAKLAYLIDATAAPICIIAPVSSWAAAVVAFAEDGQGFNLFIRAIPFNFYALLTIVMMLGIVLLKVDFGPMARFEKNAMAGDLFSGSDPYAQMNEEVDENKGIVMDLVLPTAVLVVSCIVGLLYTGGFFAGVPLAQAFSDCAVDVGLVLGSAFGLLFALIYYKARKALTFKEMMECIPEGFKAMVPAILILTFAWTLNSMTSALGAKYFVRDLVQSSAEGLQMFLPAIVFLIGCLLAFATGTSWGTFGILIPIVQNVFSMEDPIAIVCISACMAGAVCGDHCSPISDTTIMASAGAQCDHVNHVSTQLPYAITAAAVSFVAYIIAGFIPNAFIALPIAVALMIVTLLVIKKVTAKKA